MVIDGHFIIKLYLKRITMFDSEFIKNQMGLEMSVMLVKGSMMFYVSCPSWHVKKWNGIFVCLLSILSWMGLYRENLARIGAVLELHFDRFLWFPNWLGVSDDWDYSKKTFLFSSEKISHINRWICFRDFEAKITHFFQRKMTNPLPSGYLNSYSSHGPWKYIDDKNADWPSYKVLIFQFAMR